MALVCACLVLACGSGGLPSATAVYSGPISEEQNRRFFAGIEGRRVTRLLITSGGGEVDAAIVLGEWVYDRRLDVEVPEYCLSSCANYVFTAARHKRIHSGAIVAWHGNYRHLQETGLWKDDITARMRRHDEDRRTATRKARITVERLVGLERDFFARIGVDDYLCWIGKMPPYNVPDYYFLSVDDMERFGITRVQAPPDYAATDVSGFDHDIVYLRLE
jgi:hypothetical protein